MTLCADLRALSDGFLPIPQSVTAEVAPGCDFAHLELCFLPFLSNRVLSRLVRPSRAKEKPDAFAPGL